MWILCNFHMSPTICFLLIFFTPIFKKNVKTVLSSQAIQIHWWAGFGPWAVVCDPWPRKLLYWHFWLWTRGNTGLPWIHSPVTTAVFSPSAAPSYTFLLEDVEYLCDLVICHRKLKLLKQKEDALASVPPGEVDPGFLCFSPSLGFSSFCEDLLSGSMWWLVHGQQKPGQVSPPPRVHTKARDLITCVLLWSFVSIWTSSVPGGTKHYTQAGSVPRIPRIVTCIRFPTKMGVQSPRKGDQVLGGKNQQMSTSHWGYHNMTFRIGMAWTKWVGELRGAGSCSSHPVFWKGCLPFLWQILSAGSSFSWNRLSRLDKPKATECFRFHFLCNQVV